MDLPYEPVPHDKDLHERLKKKSQDRLSIKEAADLLNVSQPFVAKLLETGIIPSVEVDGQRLIPVENFLAYKREASARQRRAIDELVAQAQELNMGY